MSKAPQTILLAVIVAGLVWSAPVEIQGEPLMKIRRVNTDDFPLLKIEVTTLNPAPREENAQGGRFTILESYRGLNRLLEYRPEHPPITRAERINLVLILDATQSVPERDFRKSLQAASELIHALGPSDLAAVYRLNSTPHLLAGFTGNRKNLLEAIKSIQRTGSVTRIYDSLHEGILMARAVVPETDGPGQASVRTAVVLFTDGRDERSFINDDDCAELAGLVRKKNIPIYPVLYGKAANKRILVRLAKKTGGRFTASLGAAAMKSLFEDIGRLPEQVHHLVATSKTLEHRRLMPGDQVSLMLTWRTGLAEDVDRKTYLIPAARLAVLYLENPWVWILMALAGITLVALIVIIIYLAYRRKKKRKSARSAPISAVPPSVGRPVDLFAPQRAREQQSATRVSRPGDPGVEVFSSEDFLDEYLEGYEEVPSASTAENTPDRKTRSVGAGATAAGAAGAGRVGAGASGAGAAGAGAIRAGTAGVGAVGAGASEPEVGEVRILQHPVHGSAPAIPREGLLYMQDYSYRMLQNALRDSEPYQRATLYLRDKQNRKTHKEYDLFLETTVIGTGRWANIHLDDVSVSDVHAKIKRVDNRFVLYDLASGTGVFLNNKKLLRPRALADCDELKIGRTLFVFRGRQ